MGNLQQVGLSSGQFKQAVFDAIPEQIAVIDFEGRIVEANAAWTVHLGSPVSANREKEGSNYLEEICRLMAGQDLAAIRKLTDGIRSVMNRQLPVFNTEFRRMNRRGADRWFIITVTPFVDGGAVLVHEEITRRRILEREIISISEYERRQMGRDLHDGLCQVLSGLILTSAVTAASLKNRNAPEAEEMARLVEITRNATNQVRELARSLHPVSVDGQGLASALHEMTANVGSGINCDFYYPKEISIEDSNIALSLYRIAQEAVSNAQRHSQAKNITLSLLIRNAHLVLKVEDDGVGLYEDRQKKTGMGMQIMHYRASAMGARFHTRNLPGGGTRVSCIMPAFQIARNLKRQSS